MRAAIYCRLSKEDEDHSRESESIQNQKSMLIDYARENGFEVYNIYSDEDYSGVDRDRPAFNAMLEAAEQRKFDIILAKTQSRFTRDMELVEKYLHGKFIEWGIRFIAVVDRVDTDDLANKKSRQINGLVNEWYLEDLSNNVRSVLTHKRREGKYIATFALYGYQKDPKDKNHVVIDPEAAEVVKRIFALYLQGCGATKIAALLNAENIPNPTRYKRQHGIAYVNANAYGATDGLWARSTIYGMLRNETYAGNLVQGRHKKVSYKSKKIITLHQSEWIVAEHTHEPIVQAERFAQVQQLLARRADGGKNGMIHPLAGRVRCGMCKVVMERTGRSITNKQGVSAMYLRCRTHTRKRDACTCNTVRLAEVEELILQRIRGHIGALFDPAAVRPMPFDAETKAQSGAKQTELNRLNSEVEKRGRAMQSLYLDKTAGLIGSAQFAELNAAFWAEKEKLQERIARLEQTLREQNAAIKHTAEQPDFAAWVNRLAAVPRLTRALVVLLTAEIDVYEKDPETGVRKMEIYWNF